MADTHGGARPGSGRKRKTEKHETAINAAEKRIRDRLPALIDNLFRLAEGVAVEEADGITGDVTVYRKAPDYRANEYLINRIMGKPTERQEISDPEGNPLKTYVIIGGFNPDDA